MIPDDFSDLDCLQRYEVVTKTQIEVMETEGEIGWEK